MALNGLFCADVLRPLDLVRSSPSLTLPTSTTLFTPITCTRSRTLDSYPHLVFSKFIRAVKVLKFRHLRYYRKPLCLLNRFTLKSQ